MSPTSILILRDEALLSGFHQITSVNPQLLTEPPQIIPGVRESNPTTIFRLILLNQTGNREGSKRPNRELKDKLSARKSMDMGSKISCPCLEKTATSSEDPKLSSSARGIEEHSTQEDTKRHRVPVLHHKKSHATALWEDSDYQKKKTYLMCVTNNETIFCG